MAFNDPDLAKSAQEALHKIKAVTNTPTTSLRVGPIIYAQHNVDLHSIRQAIRHKKEILIEYLSLKNEKSTRIICPITIGYFEKNAVLVGWCIQKRDFRHFRLDRIAHLTVRSKIRTLKTMADYCQKLSVVAFILRFLKEIAMQPMTVFYVQNPIKSAAFYAKLLNAQVLEQQTTFCLLLVNGVKVAFLASQSSTA